ncbi:MAG: 6,7-dimethyl-8-ribityllumazine synthase [Spirochaetales bacterium]|nr:6,7-dimethyl-8-ribityllumazine synthase [Leptospiraceae bacterium]MCP5480199.1 6,7-dimethyl-8-ribityllumazine synthase [Spirochaetales bacterium]MCP5486402.1 6,7-dimethyl-8-ribityllumazine synthase [Spirochaetales bacterium]
MAEIRGGKNGSGQRHAVLVSEWNDFITSALLKGALAALQDHGVDSESVDVIHVPGSYELGPAARRAAQTGRYDAITCLGCVIRGATAHFDHVAGQAARLIAQASYETGLPVIFGVLTTDTIEQAIERAGTKAGNKGYESAVAAIELVNVYRQL